VRAWIVAVLAWAGVAQAEDSLTTSGHIALANLDQLLAQRGSDSASDELWLMRARYLADYAALERGAAFANAEAQDTAQLLRRARARGALHRFAAALADLDAAAELGGDAQGLWRVRASIRIAQGAADEVLPALEAAAARQPGFANSSALATAYAGAGRYEDADRAFQAALDALDTTAPFPYAWLCFARGTMWAEQAGDAPRGAAHLERALAYLPQFVAANLHLAEIEARRGDGATAEARLAGIAGSGEPEVLALLGTLHAANDPARGAREIAAARARFEDLLTREPLAFADHAAEFYLNAGADPRRALTLARMNLSERWTPRARALAERAARVAGE
jgi:tetratricopeptide (TPR) repeat protein